MTFSTTLQQLVHTRGIQYNLSRMEQALETLGHPERIHGIIHVAGTNGKGTTSDFIAQLLEHQGYRVGLYTSPHLVSYTERFRLNGLPISEDTLQAYLDALAPLIQSLELSEFEVLTLIAWQYFRDHQPDFVVIETGLGGRLDATVLCQPLVTVIASISLDHVDILGSTLIEIAKEKAGIIKQGVPCFSLNQEAGVLTILHHIAKTYRSPFFIVDRKHHYLQTNRLLAETVVKHLCPSYKSPEWLFPRIGGRQEVIRTNPTILADAAHNQEGIQALIAILKDRHFEGSVWYGATRRPELETILKELLALPIYLVILDFDHPRAARRNDYPSDLINNIPFIEINNRQPFIEKALMDKTQQICLTGSIYFLGEMIPLLREQ